MWQLRWEEISPSVFPGKTLHSEISVDIQRSCRESLERGPMQHFSQLFPPGGRSAPAPCW